ncbi:peptidylprolyl isomerase [Chloracidobacterium validum]|uniref:Peptidylprolyl isomerase n=1 Tax=Chloracidobacterium validum TaxID=2821543 RepID=A0ABX8B8P5_9BACT|nr:peptidylprolyl isomerase [Chloracidobacterium validum]QUW03309.1 peptidylprolyl isomerase [Chloracidobacterium validum]
MKKSLIIFAAVCVLASGALVAQSYLTKPQPPLTLSTADINAFLAELPAANLASLREDPKGKDEFRKQIARSLAIVAEAEQRGLFQKPELKSQLDLTYGQLVGEMWKRRPEAKEKPITSEDVAAFYRDQPTAFEDFLTQNPQFRQAPKMDELKEKYGEFQVARTRGEAAGVNKTPAFQLQWRLFQANIVGNEIIAKLQEAAKPSDEEIEAYHKAHPEEFEEYKASHILISTTPATAPPDGKAPSKPLTEAEARAKAENIIKQLQGGADFAKLAEQYSDDPGSKKQGGDLGYFREGMMVAPFFEGVKALQVGGISTMPVQTQFGFHIIKLEDKRPKALDEPTKREIGEKLRQRKVETKLDELVTRYGIVIPSDFTIPSEPTS